MTRRVLLLLLRSIALIATVPLLGRMIASGYQTCEISDVPEVSEVEISSFRADNRRAFYADAPEGEQHNSFKQKLGQLVQLLITSFQWAYAINTGVVALAAAPAKRVRRQAKRSWGSPASFSSGATPAINSGLRTDGLGNHHTTASCAAFDRCNRARLMNALMKSMAASSFRRPRKICF